MNAGLIGQRVAFVGFGNVYSRRLARFLMAESSEQIDIYSNTHFGLEFCGRKIASTDKIEELHGAVIVCPFNPGPYGEISGFLKGKLAADAVPYSLEKFVLNFGLPKAILGFPERTVLDIYKGLGSSRSPFADKVSLATLSAMAEYWASGDRSKLGWVQRPISEIYFDREVIPAGDGHVYVDAGAYTGDSFRAFSNRFPNFASATLFEPNDYEELSALECERVAVRHLALGAHAGQVKIGRDALEMVPQFGNREDLDPTVAFATLDQSIENISFLKIDCEGYDIDVLNGGAGIIAANKPIVALCVYHDPIHLIEGVQYFENIGGYNLYLRKYSADPAELVLYGVPR